MGFGCTSCGLCCANLRKTFENFNRMPEQWRNELKDFPYPLSPSGACSKFVNGRCTVYNKRPLVCSVERMHEKYFSDIPQEQYFDMTANTCNKLMDAAKSRKPRVKKHTLKPA